MKTDVTPHTEQDRARLESKAEREKTLILPNLRCNGVAKDGGAVHLELSKACIESTSSGSLQSLNPAWIKVGFPLPSEQLDQLRTCAFRPMVAV